MSDELGAESSSVADLLLGMAFDAPPPPTVPDAPPVVRGPLDAAYAGLVAAANAGDAEIDAEAQAHYEQRQLRYREAIGEAIEDAT